MLAAFMYITPVLRKKIQNGGDVVQVKPSYLWERTQRRNAGKIALLVFSPLRWHILFVCCVGSAAVGCTAHIHVTKRKNVKDIEIKQAVIVFYRIENIDAETAILKNLVKSVTLQVHHAA